MQRLVIGVVTLLFVCPVTTAQERAEFPVNLQKQIEAKMIGKWKWEGSWGDKRITGEDHTRWVGRKTGVLSVGFEMSDGKRVNWISLMGWDGDAKKLVYRSFSSDGGTWSGEWTEFSGDTWKGKGSGDYQGVQWSSETKLEFGIDSQRYEDETDGKPWIAVYSRK